MYNWPTSGPSYGFGPTGYPWTPAQPLFPPVYGFGPSLTNLYWPSATGLGWGLGGTRRWGGTYSPQFVMTGLPTDQEIVEMVYDSIDSDPIVPFDADVDVSSDAGEVTLTGTVRTKEIKHAIGDDAWWIPGVDDVNNDLKVERRRPSEREHAEEQQRPTRMTGRRG